MKGQLCMKYKCMKYEGILIGSLLDRRRRAFTVKEMMICLIMICVLLRVMAIDLLPQKEVVKRIQCESNPKLELLLTGTSTYYCTDTETLLYHSSRFKRSLTDEFLLDGKLNPLVYDWIEISVTDHQVVLEIGIFPFTSSLYLENGSNGAMQATISDTYGLGGSLDLKAALINAAVAKLTSDIKGSVGGLLTSTAEFTCSGQEGETVQLQLIRKNHIFQNSRWRKLSANFGSRAPHIHYGKWNIIPSMKALASSPIVRCVICDSQSCARIDLRDTRARHVDSIKSL